MQGTEPDTAKDTGADTADVPGSNSNKTVSFSDVVATEANSAAALLQRPQPARRRSSLKDKCKQSKLPPKGQWSHPDKILRRLRLRDRHGMPVTLVEEFRDTVVVAFLFGSTWRGASQEPYEVVSRFAERHPHRFKVVYVSVDETKQLFEDNTRGKPWLTMDWHDGSNGSEQQQAVEDDRPEPFLLPHEQDLEAELHQSDVEGTLYLRPWSRAFVAEHFKVLGVPTLVVYHLPSGRTLASRARIDDLKESGKGDDTFAKWERGESTSLGIGDVLHAMRWTLAFGAVGIAYLAATRGAGFEDVVQTVSRKLTESYLA